MNPIHALTARAAAASTRLLELEQKSERAGVTAVAVRELHSALEDLRAAIGQLNDLSERLAAAKTDAQAAHTQYDELLEAMPTACVFTDEAGTVISANAAAGELFNTSGRHLRGKPLLLFVSDRDRFGRLLNTTRVETVAGVGELTIRPRDRKPRRLAVQVEHLRAHQSRCWFFTELRATSVMGEPGEPGHAPPDD